AAADAVELGDPRDPPRQRCAAAGEADHVELLPLATAKTAWRGRRRRLLDERVPAAAGFAPAGPLGIGGAALLADEPGMRTSQFDNSRRSVRPHLHLDRSLAATVDELLHEGIAGVVDLGGAAGPDDPPLVNHRDPVGDLPCAHHVVGDRHGSGAELTDA